MDSVLYLVLNVSFFLVLKPIVSQVYTGSLASWHGPSAVTGHLCSPSASKYLIPKATHWSLTSTLSLSPKAQSLFLAPALASSCPFCSDVPCCDLFLVAVTI